MTKILILATLQSSAYETFAKEDDLVVVDGSKLDSTNIQNELKDTKVLIVCPSVKIDAEFLGANYSLSAIVVAGVSIDNVDIDECSKRSIIVMNTPNANSISASELTFAHILNASKNFISSSNDLQLEHKWSNSARGVELKDKTLGVIGFGATGSKVASLGKAFGMDVVVFDPHISSSRATNLGVDYTIYFNDILKCDFITIHTPKNEKTINKINTEEIEKMNDGVVLINVSHGGLYNEDAMFDGLNSGKIGYLGIDTFEDEPATQNKLLNLKNVCATPHIKSNTKEVQEHISNQSTKQAVLAARNISYINPVNLPIDTASLPSFIKPFIELTSKLSALGIQISSGSLQAVQLSAQGEVSEYLNSLMPLALTGVMKYSLGDQVNYLNAEKIAQDNVITFDYTAKPNSSAYKNSLSIIITTTDGTYKVTGTIFSDEKPRIVSINDIPLDIVPDGKMLVFKNSDVPGVIASIAQTLSSHSINIADFRLGRDGKGNALAIVIVDNKISNELLSDINSLDTCIWAKYVEI